MRSWFKKGGKGVVLLSGGMDSAVTAWIAREECEELYALTFRYGQRHYKEVSCAIYLGQLLEVIWHKVLELPLSEIGGSSLVGKGEIPVSGLTKGIPSTWVPQRNSMFLAFAFAWAEVLGCNRVYIGVNAVDYSGYPDCGLEFLESMEEALNLASKSSVEGGEKIEIRTPVIGMRKSEEIELGMGLKIPFEHTWSCYQGEGEACGLCDSCRLRLKAFKEAGVKDPIKYKEEIK